MRINGLAAQALVTVMRCWPYDGDRLLGAAIELGVCLELHEADMRKRAVLAFLSLPPRQQFCELLLAMELPDSKGDGDSELSGLSWSELELVWLALHAQLIHLGLMDSHEADLRGPTLSASHIAATLLWVQQPTAH